MNNRFITGLLSILIVGMVGCMIAFGINVYSEIVNSKNIIDIETTFSDINKKENIETPQIVEQEIDNVESAFSNVEYQSSASSTRYFYNQLDDYSKQIYDGLIANIDNMKTGQYKIEFGDNFSSILSGTNGEKELGEYYQSAIEAFTYDNPEIFFLDPTNMFLNIQTTTKGNKTTYNVYIAPKTGGTYLASGFYSEEQINQCQNQIEQVKNIVMNDLTGNTHNRTKQIHDCLVGNLSYDQTISKDNIYNLYGALINRECVCEGYSKAFKYLLDQAGIDNVIVLGTATNSKGEIESHAWNYVLIDGAWYAVDVTWDDPVVQGGAPLPSSYKYRYFLKGLNTINQDHIANGRFTDGGKEFTYPNLNNSDYE